MTACAQVGAHDPARLIAAPGARLLVVAPHPDDESIAVGGLLARAQALGTEVRVLLLTDGDRNPWPQRWIERRLFTGEADRARWGLRRRGEAEQAMQKLALPTSALTCLGWPDLGITERLMQHTQASISKLTAILDTFAPTVAVFPALRDRHPDHGASHVLMSLALMKAKAPRPISLCYQVHGVQPDTQPALLRLDAAELARKHSAVRAHASQLALSRGRLLGKASSLEAYWPVDPYESDGVAQQSHWVLPWHPPRLLRPACELLLVNATRAWRQPLPAQIDSVMSIDAGEHPPLFAKLRMRRRNPWIFDHWGWCRLSRA